MAGMPVTTSLEAGPGRRCRFTVMLRAASGELVDQVKAWMAPGRAPRAHPAELRSRPGRSHAPQGAQDGYYDPQEYCRR